MRARQTFVKIKAQLGKYVRIGHTLSNLYGDISELTINNRTIEEPFVSQSSPVQTIHKLFSSL